MRKILIGIIALLLVILGIMAVTKGINIGKLEVSSVSQMSEKNEKIDQKIEELNTLIDVNYPKKISELTTTSKKMQQAKEEYLKYSTISTSDEILNAMQGKVYKIEFLWTRLGQHVRNEQVVLDFKIVNSSIGESKASDLEFTVTGTYTRITNFIYAIENDEDLDFRIENFKMIPGESNVLLSATFTVRNVVIKGNTSILSVNTTNSSTTTTTTNTNTTNTNTTNTNTTNTNTTNTTSTNTTNTNITDTSTTNANTTSTNTTNTSTTNNVDTNTTNR